MGCKNYNLFPVEINKAPLEMLLRVPGIGSVSAYKIINARRYAPLDFEHLKKMRVVLKRARHFITCKGKFLGTDKSEATIKRALIGGGEAKQIDIFGNDTALSVITGQL